MPLQPGRLFSVVVRQAIADLAVDHLYPPLVLLRLLLHSAAVTPMRPGPGRTPEGLRLLSPWHFVLLVLHLLLDD